MRLVHLISIAFVFVFAFVFITSVASAAERPNVIFILTDDQGYGDLACNGNTVIQTPNLDRLCAESIRFTNFHVSATCSQTRAQLMTGRYPTRTGVWHTIAARSLLRRDDVSLADKFDAAGYDTGLFGKWHLGDNLPFRPQDRGFQEALTCGGGGVNNIPNGVHDRQRLVRRLARTEGQVPVQCRYARRERLAVRRRASCSVVYPLAKGWHNRRS